MAHTPESQDPPKLDVADRITFPSRKTTFPLFADGLGDGWLQLLNLTLRCGTVKGTSEADRLAEVLNAVVTIELAAREEALPPFFDFATEDLEAWHRRFTSASAPRGADYSYFERLRSWPRPSGEAHRPEPTKRRCATKASRG